MSATEQLLLIDLPYIAHSTFHASGIETAPERVAKQIVVRVQQLAANHPHAAVCCDSGQSFRRELDPTYKAQRDTEHRAAVWHIIGLACASLKADGFPVWSAEGFEADDVIATAARQCLEMDGSALILSSDKDLLQLVSDRVTVRGLRDKEGKLTNDGAVMDAAAVMAKLGVRPDQVLDYLSLTGDGSDNVKGADGIGPKKAAALLAQHGTLAAVYEAMAQGQPPGMTPSMRSSLVEFRDRERFVDEATGSQPVGLEHVRKLLTLRTDAPIPFHEIATERTSRTMNDAELPVGVTPERGQCAEYFADAQRVNRELTEAQAVDAPMAAAQQATERIRALPAVRRDVPPLDATIVQSVLLQGDLSRLNPSQRIAYYNRVCESLGLNPMTQPFAYLRLNGKEVLYAKKDAAEQLRFLHNISIDPKSFTREVIEGVYVVTAPASMPNGRTDVSTGAVAIDKLVGEARANAMMKAETKAKRRVTLSICGLGMLDETEVETIPEVR